MSNQDSTTDAEQSVLGSILIDPSCIDDVKAIVYEHSFSELRHRYIFNALISNIENHKDTDLVLLRNQLEQDKRLADCGGVDYLVHLAEFVPSAAMAKTYSHTVRRASLCRDTATLGTMTAQTALDPSKAPEDTLTELISNAEALLAGANIKDNTAIGDDIIQNEMSLYDGSFIKPISTTFQGIDKKLLGFEPSELTVVAARPGLGKTAMVTQMFMDMAEMREGKKDIKVGFMSAEMARKSLYFRMVAGISKVCTMLAKAHAMGQPIVFTEKQKQARLDAAKFITEFIVPNAWIDDTPGMDIGHIERVMAQSDKRVDVLFVDHLHHVAKSEDKCDIDLVMKGLYDLGRRYGHHTVLACQLNRANEAREIKKPRLSDLKGSGAIEQVANNVICLHRDSYYSKDEEDKTALAIIEKGRDGARGEVPLYWYGETTRFSDYLEM